ncbi:MAG TPA: crosslink repair DNA glycosylase YcaQ family protein, partial [Nocardioides sp.]|nr:crosslink repair DNA glycosylase YcaQ family protein [Nocardioides sp.]
VASLDSARRSDVVRFLPGHDQWVMGVGTKDVHVTPPDRRDVMTRKANPVLVGGVVRGTWRVREDELTVTWLDEGRRPRKAIDEEAARLSELVGTELRLTIEG